MSTKKPWGSQANNILSHFPYATPRPGQAAILETIEQLYDQYDVFVIVAPTAAGKCHARGQGIIMYDGSVKKVEDIVVGDLLMGPDSKPRKVLELDRGVNKMVTIVPKRGTPFMVTHNHILPVLRYSSVGRYDRAGGKRPITIHENIQADQWFSFSKTRKHCSKLWKPEDIQFPTPDTECIIPPYILGLWLGDGSADSPALTTMDDDIAMQWIEWGESNGCNIRLDTQVNNKATTIHLSRRIGSNKENPCTRKLRELNVLNNKHIPKRYLFGSRQERLELLAGLSDTDGNWNSKQRNFEITQVRKELAEQILFLMRSLGFAASISTRIINGTEYYRVSGSTMKAEEIPVKCFRKTKPMSSKSNQKHIGFTVEEAGEDEYFGFEIDGDNLYLLEDFTVTHNTALMKTLMNWKYSASAVAPTNQLVDQFLGEFPDTPTLSRLDRYHCQTWNRPCSVTRGKLRNFCSTKRGCETDCQAASDLARARYRRGPGIYNYHIYHAHKLYRDILIADEAHNLERLIQDQLSTMIWRHDYKYPYNMYTNEQVLHWVESLSPRLREHKKIKLLHEILTSEKPTHVVRRGTELFNGKGTARGQPEERDCLKFYPVDISEAPKYLWPQEVRKIILLSATISPVDIAELGLSQRRVVYLQAESPIPADRRPVTLLNTATVVYRDMDTVIPKLAEEIINIANYHGGQKGLVHVTYGMAEKLRGLLPSDRFMFHTKDDKQQVYDSFRKSTDQVLVACGMYEGVDLPDDFGRFQVIAKTPWKSLADPAIKYKSEQNEEWYNWQALRDLIQACGRVCRHEKDHGVTYILDSTVNKLLDSARHLIPQWFQDALEAGK